ncbi:salicylate synthase [Kribbella sp. NPDC056861]|uniref:salicylate synthase n=1 Tax=Kribbella sp. NPDC056861 TaxID=3154857 RepID=UPI00342449CA
MTMKERLLPCSSDPIQTAAALCARSDRPHLLYEAAGAVSWAEGERVVVDVRADHISCSHSEAGPVRHPVITHPLAAAGRALGDLIRPGDRVYGWVTFELGAENATGSLARLVLPEREIRFDDESVLLRAEDEAALDLLEKELAESIAENRTVSGERALIEIDSDHQAADYLAAVTTAVAAIQQGRLDKVILSRTVPVPGNLDLAATYLAGRRGNTPARSFLLRLGGWEAAGFSPEIIARIDTEGVVVTQPLAGTRALSGDAADDRLLRDGLRRDPKEVFEHAISVRLAADELAGMCAPDTVRVSEFMSVKERGSVQHLASEVSGDLLPGTTSWDALAALFPAVTASGIPKAAARQLIAAAETERGLYSGAVLTADADGTLDAALVLRTAFRRNGRTWLRAGAGIVSHSTPDRELEETREKLASVARFLVAAQADS